MGRAGFARVILAPQVLPRVFLQRHGGIAALLGAVVHQAVFADVEVTAPGAATPVVRPAVGDVFLKLVKAGVDLPAQVLDGAIDPLLRLAQGAHLAPAVVDDAERAGQAQPHGPASDHYRVFRIMDTGPDHRVDVHSELGVLGQQLELLIEHLQAFFGDIIGLDIVDADLQVLQPRPVEPLDALGGQQVAVGDEPGHDAVVAHAADDLVQLRMEHGLAAADGDDGGAERRQPVNPFEHIRQRDRRGEVVVLVAVGAGQIAPADGDNVGQDRVPLAQQTFGDHPPFPESAMDPCFLLSEGF